MSIDFPRAWEIVRDTVVPDHHPECSWRVTGGALLCDCDVLNQHPETLDTVMHTRGGVISQLTIGKP